MTSFVTNGFYIISVAGGIWQVGDVAYFDGSGWVRIPSTNFRSLKELNKPSTDRNYPSPQSIPSNGPNQWSQDPANIYWYGPAQYDTAAQITISYTPVGEIDSIPLTSDARQCIIDGALSLVYGLPGAGQNIQLAEMRDKRFNRELENLRSMGIFGSGGDPWNRPGNFTGRNLRYSGGWL